MTTRQTTLLAMVTLLLFLVYDSVFTVRQSQRALVFRLEQIQPGDYAPGLHFKLPVVDRDMILDGRLQTLDSQTGNFSTADGKVLEVDYYVRWRIDDVATFYRATTGQQGVAGDRLASLLDRYVRDSFGKHTVAQIVGGEQEDVVSSLVAGVKDKAALLGVAIVDVRFKHISLPPQLADSVYQRMRAEESRVAADLRARATEGADKVRSDADAQAQVLLADAYRDAEKARGEGDAKAAEIYAAAYGQDPEFFRFYRSINAYRQAFHGGNDVMVLQPKGEFFRYFGDSGAKH